MADNTPRPTIRAIETRYAGHRFRSRLEARWAVFLDTLDLDWQYEPEGFNLEDGTRYLPDFHVDGVGWLEIKPRFDSAALDAISEVGEAHGETGYLIAMPAIPDPAWVRSSGIYGCNGWESLARDAPGIYVSCDSAYHWCECPYCHAIGIQYNARSGRNNHTESCRARRGDEKNYNANSEALIYAYSRARTARFEHGEAPRITAPRIHPPRLDPPRAC